VRRAARRSKHCSSATARHPSNGRTPLRTSARGVPDGGGREPGDSLAEATHRELREETAIEATLTGLRKIRHNVTVPRGSTGCPKARMPESVHRLIADQSLAGDPTTG